MLLQGLDSASPDASLDKALSPSQEGDPVTPEIPDHKAASFIMGSVCVELFGIAGTPALWVVEYHSL